MYSAEFEALLASKYNCYIVKPSAINWTVDSEFLTDTDMISILDHEQDISKCVRRRSEQVGKLSYYFRNRIGGQYFKVVESTSGGNTMAIEIPKEVEHIFWHGVSGFLLGFSATLAAQPSVASLTEFQVAIYGAVVVGAYGAFKEILNVIETAVSGKATAAGKPSEKIAAKLL